MTFRKLRIAWSVGCGIACVLLIALWIRSYWHIDIIETRKPFPASAVGSGFGITLARLYKEPMSPQWSVRTYSTKNQEKMETIFGFSVDSSAFEFVITFPHWLILSFLGILAVFARLPWRFSLRTML